MAILLSCLAFVLPPASASAEPGAPGSPGDTAPAHTAPADTAPATSQPPHSTQPTSPAPAAPEPAEVEPGPAKPTVPYVAAAECPVPAPDGTACGELVVPELRSRPDGPKVRIPYAVVPAADPRPGTPPLVVMNGGPGSATLGLANYWASLDVARHRDVVLVEQRGGRLASPSLACPAADTAYVTMLTTTGLTSEEATPVADAMGECLDEFVADGRDPAGYTIAQTAEDVRDLRVALGYPTWIAYGVSWSTRVMSEVAALDPGGVSAVVLDSFLPPDQDAAHLAHYGLQRALDHIGRTAGDEYSDPYADLMTAAQHLDEHPASVAATDPVNDEPITLRLTGTDLVTVIHAALYDVELIPIVPHVLHQLARGDLSLLDTLVPVGLDELVSHSLGQYWTMQCQDEVPYDAPIGDDPRAILWLAVDEVVCPRLGLVSQPAGERAAVTFSQPTLVLAGTNDPVTPADIAEITTVGLPDRTFLEFAGTGHAVLLSSRCARDVVAAWVDDPHADVGGLCDRAHPVYPVVQADDLHPSTAVGHLALAADRGSITPFLLPALWAGLCVVWLLGGTGAVVWAASRHRPVRDRLLWTVPPLLGVGFAITLAWAVVSTADAQPMLLAVGLPAWARWLLLLPALGFGVLVWLIWRARRSRRQWALLACAGLVWLAFLVWLVATVYVGDPVFT